MRSSVGIGAARMATTTLVVLPVDVLTRICSLAGATHALCVRATCRALRDAAGGPTCTPRSAMLRTRALAAWAWDLPGFRSAAFGVPEQAELCALAAREGLVGALAWLRERGCALHSTMCVLAAQSGHLDALRWARAHGCEWDNDTCAVAAAGGHLDVLRWAREHGCTWREDTCTAAARAGHLHVLQWARVRGCEWSDNTSFAAARHGRVELLRWARAHGCPWTLRLCVSVAAAYGHAETLAWLQLQAGTGDELDGEAGAHSEGEEMEAEVEAETDSESVGAEAETEADLEGEEASAKL